MVRGPQFEKRCLSPSVAKMSGTHLRAKFDRVRGAVMGWTPNWNAGNKICIVIMVNGNVEGRFILHG